MTGPLTAMKHMLKIIFDDREILARLADIQASQQRMDKKMDDLATQLNNLTSVVGDVTSDVTGLLDELKNAGNINPDQRSTLDGAISALRQLHQTMQDRTKPILQAFAPKQGQAQGGRTLP